MRKKALQERIFFGSLVVLAFSLPIMPRFSGVVMAFMMLHWLLQFDYMQRLKMFFKNKVASAMVAFYFLFLIGMAWTENIEEGKQQLVLLTSIWMLPLIFSSSNLFPKSKEKILQAFIAGCFGSAIICLGYASFIFITQHKNIFFYSGLTDVLHLHPSYAGVYVLFACMLLMRKWIKKKMMPLEKNGTIALLLFFFVYLILLSARAQLIIFILMVPALLYFKNKTSAQTKPSNTIKIFLTSGLLIALFISAVFIFPGTRTRVVSMVTDWNSAYSETDPKSIPERKVIWECATEIIGNNPVFGVGTGDVQQSLQQTFLQHNWKLLASRNFNSHNQFLQLGIMLGVPAVLLFVWLLWFLWNEGKKRKQILLQGFIFIFVISMLTEAMLESEAGVVFFSFIIGLLACKNISNENDFTAV